MTTINNILKFFLARIILFPAMVFAYKVVKLHPPLEHEHAPPHFTTTMMPYIKDTNIKLPAVQFTPDFRIEEPVYTAFKPNFYREEQRPYRMSPHYKQAKRWSRIHKPLVETSNVENPFLLGCYCTTVFQRVIPLAGCAVISTRHLLTTATSTETILRTRRKANTLENILGAWYDINEDIYNSSMYITPSRIHYHPRYMRPFQVNHSHPIPCSFDLAVWATTFRFFGSYHTPSRTCICQRGGSSVFQKAPPIPFPGQLLIIVGFQFMWAYKRKPMPWMKYAVRTRKYLNPCPKTDWGWFNCVQGDWAKLGLDSGAALHLANELNNYLEDGLIGLNAFSMKLRSMELVHYFTVLNTHPVLDFLYKAYMGRLPYEYLDYRFYNSLWRAPIPKPWFYIPWEYHYGDQYNYLPNFN